jgi:hypothetical protein
LRRFKCALVEIKYRFALCADEVVMRFGDGVHTNGAVMKAEFAKDTAFNEGMKRFVNGSERDAGNLLPDNVVDFLWTGMTGSGHERFVDDSALVRDGKSMPPAKLAKIGLALWVHLVDSMRAKP